jgi:hypothetical protein
MATGLMVRLARRSIVQRRRYAPPHHEDASNDGCYVRSNNCRINVVILPFGDIISFMMVK